MPGLLQSADERHLDRRQHEFDLPRLPFRTTGVQHVRQRGVVRLGLQARHVRDEDVVDLRADGVADRLLRRVALEVRRAGVHGFEPPPERVGAEVVKAEHASEAEHGDGLEVRGHEFGLDLVRQRVGEPFREGTHELVDVALDGARPEPAVEAAPQLMVDIPVDGDDRRRPERHLGGRRAVLRREGSGVLGDTDHVGVPSDEPGADAGDEADRHLTTHARVDGVGVGV